MMRVHAGHLGLPIDPTDWMGETSAFRAARFNRGGCLDTAPLFQGLQHIQDFFDVRADMFIASALSLSISGRRLTINHSNHSNAYFHDAGYLGR